MLPRRAEVPFVVSRFLFSPELGSEVEHPSSRDCRFESVCLRNSPLGHVSAVRPTADAEPVRVVLAASKHRVYAGHQVFEIAATPIRVVPFQKFLAITR